NAGRTTTRFSDLLSGLGRPNAGPAPVSTGQADDPRVNLPATARSSDVPPAKHEGVFSAQLLRGVTSAIRQGSGSVTIRLHPEALGQLKISIQMPDGDGTRHVSAKFEASTDAARILLDQSLTSLRDALHRRGLDVGDLRAELTEPNPQSGDPGSQQHPGSH